MNKKLLVFFLIVILGVGGFFGWQYWQDKNTKNDTANNSQQIPSDLSEGGKYLVIKEWGVRVKKGEKTKDLTYAFLNPETSDSVNFGLESLGRKYTDCLPQNTGLSRGLNRSKINDFGPNESFTKIGEYYYSIASGGASCLDIEKVSQEETASYGAARTELIAELQQLESIK